MLSFVKAMDKVNVVVKGICAVLMGTMAIVIILQIFSRALFDASLSWSEEIARYFSIYAVFLAASLALRNQGLIAVEIIHEILPVKVTKWLKILVYVICIIFFILLFDKGMEMVSQVHNQKSPALQIPMSIPYASVPIGAALLLLNSIVVIIELVKGVGKK